MKVRRSLARVHKWVGLAVALFVAVQCVTGLLLVYEADIIAMAMDDHEPPIDESRGVAGPKNVERLLAAVRQDYEGFRVARIDYPARAGYPFLIHLEGAHSGSERRLLSARPLHGGFELQHSRVANALGFLFDLHHQLLGGSVGRNAVGVLGLLYLFMTASGLIVWWPGVRRLRNSLSVSARHSITFIRQLHRAVGVIALPLVAVTLITGSLLAFRPLLQESIAGSTPPGQPERRQFAGCTPGTVADRLSAAMQAFPDLPVRDLRFSDDGTRLDRVLYVNQTRAGVSAPHQVWLESCRPIVRQTIDARADTYDTLFAWLYPVHTGLALGRIGQAGAVLSASLLGGILVTGLLLWLRRRRSGSARAKSGRDVMP